MLEGLKEGKRKKERERRVGLTCRPRKLADRFFASPKLKSYTFRTTSSVIFFFCWLLLLLFLWQLL